MARKQFGWMADDLLARVDARATELGQTRRAFAERALEAALSGDTQAASPGPPAGAGERGGHSHTGSTASAIGAVPARGASRPAAPPRAPAPRNPPRPAAVDEGLQRFKDAQARLARAKPKKAKP